MKHLIWIAFGMMVAAGSGLADEGEGQTSMVYAAGNEIRQPAGACSAVYDGPMAASEGASVGGQDAGGTATQAD